MKDTPWMIGVVTAAGLVIGVGLGQEFARAGLGTEAIVACGVMVTLALGRFLWIGFALRGPIRKLTDAADRVTAGDLWVRVPRSRRAEVEPLARAFRRMVRRLRIATLSRDDLSRVLRSMQGALFVVAPDGRIRSANQTAGDLVGCTVERLVGRRFDELVVLGSSLAEIAVTSGHGGQIEVDLRAADGEAVPVLLALSPIDGRPDVVCVAQEIRERRDVEARLQRINVQLWLLNQVTTIALRTRELDPALHQIADALHGSGSFSAVGFALCDPTGELLRMRSAAGLDPGIVSAQEERRAATSLLWQVIEQREPIILHMEGSRLDLVDPLLGTVSAGILGVFPMRVEGRPIGVAVFAEERLTHDAEDFGRTGVDLAQHVAALVDQKVASEALRRSNHELELARLAAEDANRAKSEFLANMSHEIRTPMTAILGYADLVREESDDPRATTEFVATIRRNGEHLMSIVNDILDLSKIEAGKMSLEVVPCSPVRAVIDVVELVRRRAEDRSIALRTSFEWPLPERVESDPTRLRQVLVNLVANAIKFTEQGEVCVAVRRHPTRQRTVVFEVSDSGIGMTASELGRLFKPFSQVDSTHARRFGGTGLGLAISQRLAALLGGGISVQSRKGAGSTFCLEIDGGELARGELIHSLDGLRADDAPAPQGSASTGPRRLEARVLVAEDGPDNQKLISYLLRKAGATVEVVADGQAAVDAVRTAVEAGEPFDVVLMDMQMPVIDGYEATRRLRDRSCRTPIVALTAHAMQGDAEKCREAGCDLFLSKPIDRAALIAAVAAMSDRARGRTPIVR